MKVLSRALLQAAVALLWLTDPNIALDTGVCAAANDSSSSAQQCHSQPQPTAVLEGVPVIDLSALNEPSTDSTAFAALASEVGAACEQWGFFQVGQHVYVAMPISCHHSSHDTGPAT